MVNVRRGLVEDYPGVLKLLSQVWDDDYVQHLWIEWVNEPAEGIVLIAEDEGDIIGTSYVDFMPHGACWFQALRVHPEYRRLGVGSALTRASIEHARAYGRHYAYLGIDADNTASLTMTAKAGFKQLTEYSLLAKQIPATEEEVALPTAWRKASKEDVPAMLELARRHGRKEFIACWQWQPLSQESLEDNIQRNNLWVWQDEHAFIFAGFEDFEAHPHLFDPCGEPEAIKELIITLGNSLARSEEAIFEVWLSRDNPLIEWLTGEQGFIREEGYTIWAYPLQPIS